MNENEKLGKATKYIGIDIPHTVYELSEKDWPKAIDRLVARTHEDLKEGGLCITDENIREVTCGISLTAHLYASNVTDIICEDIVDPESLVISVVKPDNTVDSVRLVDLPPQLWFWCIAKLAAKALRKLEMEDISDPPVKADTRNLHSYIKPERVKYKR